MRLVWKLVVIGGVLFGIAFMLFAPVFYFYTGYSILPNQQEPVRLFVAYRSLGCFFFGFGDTYVVPYGVVAGIGGLSFSCARIVFQ
jgi:hypothetical protein